MGSRLMLACGLAAALLWVPTAAADPITLTGNVAQDFSYNASGTGSTNPEVDIIQHSNIPDHIAQPQWMTSSGLVSGWNINNVAVGYDPTSDTLYVGVKTFGVAGNVDGNGTPGTPDPRLTADGGTDPANFGGDKAMAIGIAPVTHTFTASNPPEPTIVAGVPGHKAEAGSGLDGFTVASYAPVANTAGPNYDLVTSFGQPLAAAAGSRLAFDPSSQHPGFEFTITNFSKLLGYNPLNGFALSVQDGSVDSVVTGKDYVPSTLVTFPQEQRIPEPATWMAWLFLAGAGAAVRCRRSTPASSRGGKSCP
ncbi:MAG TPA: hypothetical protein VFF52_21595 [Isosphaeraceae bacterium]|nr:hypothetical protein [Isosphaeraceae bacterium]